MSVNKSTPDTTTATSTAAPTTTATAASSTAAATTTTATPSNTSAATHITGSAPTTTSSTTTTTNTTTTTATASKSNSNLTDESEWTIADLNKCESTSNTDTDTSISDDDEIRQTQQVLLDAAKENMNKKKMNTDSSKYNALAPGLQPSFSSAAASPSDPSVGELAEVCVCPICCCQYATDGAKPRSGQTDHRPRTLPCGHSICTNCICGLINNTPAQKCCPVCRKPITIKSVNEVAINFAIIQQSQGIMKFVQQASSASASSSSNSSPCDSKQCRNPATKYCEHCEAVFCDACIHKPLKDHNIIPAADAQRVPTCKEHTYMKARLFCQKDGQIICDHCLLPGCRHHGCPHVLVTIEASNKRAEIEKCEQRILNESSIPEGEISKEMKVFLSSSQQVSTDMKKKITANIDLLKAKLKKLDKENEETKKVASGRESSLNLHATKLKDILTRVRIAAKTASSVGDYHLLSSNPLEIFNELSEEAKTEVKHFMKLYHSSHVVTVKFEGPAAGEVVECGKLTSQYRIVKQMNEKSKKEATAATPASVPSPAAAAAAPAKPAAASDSAAAKPAVPATPASSTPSSATSSPAKPAAATESKPATATPSVTSPPAAAAAAATSASPKSSPAVAAASSLPVVAPTAAATTTPTVATAAPATTSAAAPTVTTTTTAPAAAASTTTASIASSAASSSVPPPAAATATAAASSAPGSASASPPAAAASAAPTPAPTAAATPPTTTPVTTSATTTAS